uniref:Uncharacterized protein n=1 Tax=Chrysemys picta bellii TaxID=8478 RepID=A0A8C3HQE4_CHRPI
MGCASAKHVSTVQNEEEAQKGKNYQNGDVFGDEYRIKPVEEVKYMKNGGEDDQKVAARNQENLEKSASSNVRLKSNKEVPGLVHQPRANMHISESQQEFFRMLDEKIEKVNQTDSHLLQYLQMLRITGHEIPGSQWWFWSTPKTLFSAKDGKDQSFILVHLLQNYLTVLHERCAKLET